MAKPRIRYTREGWFGILEFLSGTRDWHTGALLPDAYGCLKRRLIVGPYNTASEAGKAFVS